MPRAVGGRKLAESISGAENQKEFRRGVEEFNAEKFFEAHETWEAIWLKAPEPDKTFLQGITQVSAAFHHLSRSNSQGADSLLRKGLQKLQKFPAGYRGIQLEKLRVELRAWAGALADSKVNPELKKPRVEWSR